MFVRGKDENALVGCEGLDRERLVDDDFVGGNLLDDVGVAISEDIGREVGDEIRVVNKGEFLEDLDGLGLDRERLVDDDFVGGNLLDDVGVAISEDIGREIGDEIRVVNKGEFLEDRDGLGLDRERLVDDDFVGGNLLDDVGVAISEDIGREVGDEIRVVNKGEVLEDRGGLRGDGYPVK